MTDARVPVERTASRLPGHRFECPVCEFDHNEAGFLVGADVIYCPLCYEDNHRLVVLRRW